MLSINKSLTCILFFLFLFVVRKEALSLRHPFLDPSIPSLEKYTIGGHTVYYRSDVKVTFKIKQGRLIVGSKAVSYLPIPEQLYLLIGHTLTEIKTLENLKGKVELRSAAEALAFVRLLRSSNGYAFVEVTAKNDKTDKVSSGFQGMVSPIYLKRMGISPVTCRRTKQGFEIRRTLLKGQSVKGRDRYSLEKRVEFVGADGSYQVQERKAVKVNSIPQVDWYILRAQ